MPIKAAFILPHPPVIIPEVGGGREREIQRTIDSYNEAGREVAESAPETVVLLSPHAITYMDYFHIATGEGAEGSLSQFGAPNVCVKIKYDRELADAIKYEAEKYEIPAGGLGEKDKSLDHASIIPLFFVQKFFKGFKVVKISPSGLTLNEHYKFGEAIKSAADKIGRNIVVLASGDLSHKLTRDGPYGFAEEGPNFDKQVTQAIESGDLQKFLSFDDSLLERAAECGLRAFSIMAGCLDGMEIESKLLSYEGPFGVGYAVASFKVRVCEDEFVKLARYSLEGYVKNGMPSKCPNWVPKGMLNRQAGVFVSLKKHGELRGCIGTIAPAAPSIADEILRNAISAGTQDPRFPPVAENELDELVYSVDVLSEAERIDSPEQLDVKKYGVIVSDAYRRGLLLPNLDGVDTVEYQVAIALQKAGISREEPFRLERFEVVRHK